MAVLTEFGGLIFNFLTERGHFVFNSIMDEFGHFVFSPEAPVVISGGMLLLKRRRR